MIQRAATADDWSRPRGRQAQVLLLIVPPLAMLANLEASYVLVPEACDTGSKLVLHLVHAGMLLVTVVTAVLARRWWRRTGWRWPDEGGGALARTRFLGVVGLWSSVLFGLVILSQWFAVVMWPPCL